MTPQRILVTGAGGFVGSHLVPALRESFPAAAMMLAHHGARPGFEALDITDAAAVEAMVSRFRPDCCIHLAAIAAIPAARAEPDLAWRVNLGGTLALARAMRAAVPDCVFLFISSADIYGASFRAGTPLDETGLLAPLNTYAATKAAADLAVGVLAAEGLRAIRLRAFNHTGPGQAPAFAVPAFARQIARISAGLQEPILRTGALDPQRDFLDVRDVCAAYVASIRAAERWEPGTILNIASGTPRRIGDVLDAMLAAAGTPITVETDSGFLRPTDIAVATGDASRARSLLGWAPAIDWSVTLRDVMEDWRTRIAREQAGSADGD